MMHLLMNDEGNFANQLRKLSITRAETGAPLASTPDLNQWLQYWDDADSVNGNLRRLQHWLQRARPEPS